MKLEFSRKSNGRTGHEEPFQQRANHRGIETARGRGEDGGVVPGTWDKRGDVYQWKSKFGGMEVSGAQR
jgi:hypothetical protein